MDVGRSSVAKPVIETLPMPPTESASMLTDMPPFTEESVMAALASWVRSTLLKAPCASSVVPSMVPFSVTLSPPA